jgi:hypothetical protein
MNLPAEYQVWATLNHQGVSAVLLNNLWSLDGQGKGKKSDGDESGGKDGKPRTDRKAHGNITPQQCNRIHRVAQAR